MQDVKFIDTPNSYSGNFNTIQAFGVAPSPGSVGQGQLCTDYFITAGDVTVSTVLKP